MVPMRHLPLTLALLAAPTLLLAQGPASPATSSVKAFRYQPARALTGTLLHYVKSNVDGSDPAQIYVYMPTPDRVEVLKVEPGSPVAAFVSADLDWTRFSARSIDSWHLRKDGSLKPQATSALDEAGVFSIRVGGATFPVKVRHFPVHNYNFDLTSLNVSLPFLSEPEAPFEVGIVEPDWAALGRPGFRMEGRQEGIFVDRGTVTFTYLGREQLQGRPCRKYAAVGPGLSPGQGTLWTDLARGFLVAFEHPKPDNPDWNSFRLTLKAELTLSPGKWKALQAAQRAGLPEASR